MSRKLLKQGFLYHKLRKTFGKFYNRNFDLVEPFNSSLINLIEGGISHPHFYGDFLKNIKKGKIQVQWSGLAKCRFIDSARFSLQKI